MAATLGRSGVLNPVHKYAVFMGMVSLFKGVVCSSQPSVSSRSNEHTLNKQTIRECEDKPPNTITIRTFGTATTSTECPF